MRKYLAPIAIGIMLGISCAIIGIRLHGFYKECKREEPKRMFVCILQKDNKE
jgi:hypothetical protein